MTDQLDAKPAKIKKPRRISPFWLLPIVAFIIGCLLFFQILQERGEIITIRFHEGNGITAGKTAVRYQGLQIGVVKKVYFVDNLKEVEVQAEINPEARSVLKEGTQFWLVKATASLAGISGLDTLVSGNYITLKPNNDPNAKREDEFIAEDEAPLAIASDDALLVKLISDDLGSLSSGSPVYYRKAPVGQVADYRFSADRKKVEIDLLINKKDAGLVKKNSRFWNISGVNVKANLSGVDVSMDSLASMVIGGVAFDSPDNAEAAEQGQTYSLYHDFKSAKRGIDVQILVPMNESLKLQKTGVFHKNVQIGILTDLMQPKDINGITDKMQKTQQGILKGTLLIDPNYIHLFKTETKILLREPKFSLNADQISKISDLFRGAYFDVISGSGKEQLQFNVEREEDFLLNLPNMLTLTFHASESYGVDEGQGIYYNDVQIGEILKRKLTLNNVEFQGVIYPPYRHLVGQNSKFMAISNLDVNIGLDGLRIKAGSPSDWVKGGVRLISDKPMGEAKSEYPLYKDTDHAELGVASSEKRATLTLSAKELSGISQGSVVLYRNFQVGEVLKVSPTQKQFEVDLFIEPAYRHLISDKNRYWVEPAVSADVSLKGVNIQAAPIMRTLKGAISFDNQAGSGSKTLFASKDKALSGNTYLTLIAKDASKLSEGMDIKYMGLTVGKVEKLELQNVKKQIKATAYIEGQYYPLLTKVGSKFNVISPELSTSGVKNIDAALQNYISVEAGSGKTETQFTLEDTDTLKTTYDSGFPVIVETSDAQGIQVEAPVLYRGMQVGIVKKMSLSELGDRVFIHLAIENKYQHLVRNNTEFWAASGYTMDISLQGVSMNSGTMSQLLNGGIAFSTPSSRVVQPQAKPNRHFLLQRKIPQEAPEWDQGIAE